MIVAVWLAFQHFRGHRNYVNLWRTILYFVARTLHHLFIGGLSTSKLVLMGSCICKDQDDCYGKADDDINSSDVDDEQFVETLSANRNVTIDYIRQNNSKIAIIIDRYVLETLSAIRTLVDK